MPHVLLHVQIYVFLLGYCVSCGAAGAYCKMIENWLFEEVHVQDCCICMSAGNDTSLCRDCGP